MSVAHAVVVAASVATAESSSLGAEPITTATLRDDQGDVHTVRIMGGPNARGGTTRLAGYVVPVVGASVRLDLREDLRHDGARPALPAWVPNVHAATWPLSALPVSFTLAAPSRDLGDQSLSELDLALRTWPIARCTAWRARLASASRITTVIPADDGINAVFWHDIAWPAELVPGALGQTVVHTDAAGNVHDTDIHLNGADFRWSLDGSAGTVDARGVLVHELGHALGLGHTEILGATMFATNPRGTAWRSLEKDDVDGVCALYPGVGVIGCDAPGSGAACPGGFVCVAGACERMGARSVVCAPCARVPGACEGAGDEARCIDVGAGALAGRVCGRTCARDEDCGARFTCRATSAAGDLQCVPTDGCKSGPNPCTTNAQCPGALCRGGACLGAANPAIAIADAGADATTGADNAPAPLTAGGGCTAPGTRRAPFGAYAAYALLALLGAVRRRRGRRGWRPSSLRRARRASSPTSP